MNLEAQLIQGVINAIQKLHNQKVKAETVQFQKTKKEFEGDMTLVVFPFVKIARKSPEQTAEEIALELKSQFPMIKSYNIIKGFLNLSIDSIFWLNELDKMHSENQFGVKTPTTDSDLMMVEYSSPNTNKPLHLGHIRNNLLGYSISEIQKANGWNITKTNIVNDRGI
ncbi:MAG: arginine--tRNA ligase domain-containing protein, partial [Paludibacteraceae bacterium]